MNKKLAICVPYRNREEHLKKFVPYLTSYLDKHNISHKIFICHQADDKVFNRGKTKNIAYDYAQKEGYDYFAFHDIDMLPEDDTCDYSYPSDFPVHLSNYISSYDYQLPYPENFGGCILLTKEQFQKVNGYCNDYWDWGAEDDDLFQRCKIAKLIPEKYLPLTMDDVSTFYFNGKNSNITIPATDSVMEMMKGDYSISLCIKPEEKLDLPYYQLETDSVSIPIISSCNQIHLAYSNAYTYESCIYDTEGKESFIWTKRDPGIWTWITIINDSTNDEFKLFINGKEVEAQSPLNTKNIDVAPFNKDIVLGSICYLLDTNVPAGFFKGEMAQLCFWDKTLTQDDINMHLDNSQNPDANNLLLFYDFKSVDGNKIVDKSGNGNHGYFENGILKNSQKLKVVMEQLPERRPGRYLCLPHKNEGIVDNKFTKGAISQKNELMLVEKIRNAKSNLEEFSQSGLSTLDYKLIKTEEIYKNHTMIHVEC